MRTTAPSSVSPPDPDPTAADAGIAAAIDQFGVLYPFPLDAFQREAVAHLLRGDSAMVAAPTGTGKTIVADFGVYQAFRGAGRVLYTTPIKALSNQKFRDLRAIYGDEVGLLTGDVSENRDARVVVMTTEVLRNMLLQSPWDLDAVDCVIFDEIHYLADPERGTTWEEAIILCPDHVQLICLSATVSNAAEIAAWISRTHRPIRLVSHTERAVPLALDYFIDGKLHQVVDHTGAVLRDFPGTGGELRRQAGRGRGFPRGAERATLEMEEPQPREIIDALAAKNLLPAIYFLFSRNDCQSFAERLAVMRPHLITESQAAQVEATLDAYLATLRPEDRELDQVKLITDLARRGIGFHHAGLLPILKQLVEVLFGRGLMQVVFATDTLALGVNMPARTVVVGRMSKWDGRRRRTLLPNEFQQMAGRAGRRGMDAFGHVVVPYSPWISFRDTLEVATGPLLPVRSAFAIRYNTVLNLWDPPDGERVRLLLQQSLAQFQTGQRVRQLEEDIVEIGGDLAGIPHGAHGCLLGHPEGDDLLEDYRGLVNTLTAAQARERRLREDLVDTRAEAAAPPWPEPSRQALRRAFRGTPPGLLAHVRELGWGVFLGHGGRGGVGRFLFGETIRLLAEYRQIDYLTDGVAVDLPASLIEPPDEIEDATRLAVPEDLAGLAAQIEALGLPDLDALVAEHRAREERRVAAGLAGIAAEIDTATAQAVTLGASRDAHPCHPCPVRKEHRDNLARVDRLHRERNALQEFLARETDAEEARIRGVIRGIRDVLHRFGYLHRGYPTAKADMLADVFDNDGLILCELVDRGWLDRLAPEDLAEVFSWFSFDREYRQDNRFTLPDGLVLLRRRLEELERDVLAEERDHGLFISEGHNPAFYGAARAWSRGATMADIGEAIQLSEGDLVLTFNKTIDLMRQIREMLAQVQPDAPLRSALRTAEGLLRRGIVEQSLTLGYAPIADPGAQTTPDGASPDGPTADQAVDGITTASEDPADLATPDLVPLPPVPDVSPALDLVAAEVPLIDTAPTPAPPRRRPTKAATEVPTEPEAAPAATPRPKRTRKGVASADAPSALATAESTAPPKRARRTATAAAVAAPAGPWGDQAPTKAKRTRTPKRTDPVAAEAIPDAVPPAAGPQAPLAQRRPPRSPRASATEAIGDGGAASAGKGGDRRTKAVSPTDTESE